MDPRDHGSRTPGPGRPRMFQMHRGATTRRRVPLRRSRSNHCTRPVGHTPPRQPPATAQLPLAASQSPPLPMIAVDSTTTPGRSAAPEAKVPAPSAGTFASHIRVRSSVDRRTCARSSYRGPSTPPRSVCGHHDRHPAHAGARGWYPVPPLVTSTRCADDPPAQTRRQLDRRTPRKLRTPLDQPFGHHPRHLATNPPEPHHRRLTSLMFPTTAAVGSSRPAVTSAWDRLHTRSDCLLAATAPGLRWPGS